MSGIGAQIFGGDMAEFGGYAAMVELGGVMNGLAYLFMVPQSKQTDIGGLEAFGIGMLTEAPLDDVILGWNK